MSNFIASVCVSIFFVLILFSSNMTEMLAENIIRPLIVVSIVSVLLNLIFNKVLKDSIKGIVFTFFFLLYVFSFVYVQLILFSMGIQYAEIMTLALMFVLLVAIFVGLYVSKRKFANLKVLLNTVSITLVVVAVGNIILNYPTWVIEPTDSISYNGERNNVYHIILDTYSSNEVLLKDYGYDNTEFLNYLRSKGFYVAENSHSSYGGTFGSLAATLNMAYTGDYAEKNNVVDKVTSGVVANNTVMKTFKGLGYNNIFISSGHFENVIGKRATIYNRPYFSGLTYFERVLFETTMLSAFTKGIVKDQLRENILYVFDELKVIDVKESFIFAHVISPHIPFVFGPNGERVDESNYVDQTKFINMETKEVIDSILVRDPKAIILLQSDHGMNSSGILNAFYFPDKNYKSLYDTINPVNSFRVIFRDVYGLDYDLLPDRN